jgi:iron complex outermembrane receptor protein
VPAVNPETLDAYEVGIKSDLLDRRLRFNLSGFYYNYKNIQLTAIENAITRIYNAAKGRVKGADLEIIAAPPMAEGSLEVRAGVSYLDGKYNKFNINGVCYTPRPAPEGGNSSALCNLTGKNMIRTPPVTVNLAVDYKIPVGDAGDLGFNVSSYFNSGYYFEPDNRIRQRSYTLLNAQVSFTAPDSRWRVAAFARNITKQQYISSFSQGAAGDQAAPGAPRTYGLTLVYKYGG